MYLHGAPAHADHLKQGDSFHIAIFELFILCSAQAAITALWMLSLGIFRAFPGFSLSSLHTTKNLHSYKLSYSIFQRKFSLYYNECLWYVTCSWRGCFLVCLFLVFTALWFLLWEWFSYHSLLSVFISLTWDVMQRCTGRDIDYWVLSENKMHMQLFLCTHSTPWI